MPRSVCLLAAVCLAALLLGTTQPDTVKLNTFPSAHRPIDGPKYAAWIPPGTYSAIVLNSSGNERRWAVSLMTSRSNVPVVVPPNDNIVLSFKEGWTVSASDNARLVSNLVPFDDSALFNKVGEQPRYVLSAWGITAEGPVQFTYREVKD
jgi:hypothetical protein